MTVGTAQGLLGRDSERAVLREVMGAAREAGAAVLVGGEAGIGKSALMRDLHHLASASGFTVAACRPAEGEAGLAWSALGDLLGDLHHDLAGRLPQPQRKALARALHVEPAPPRRVSPSARTASAGAFLEDPDDVTPAAAVATATTNLLREAAASTPLCLLIDDVQWLDAPTEQALRFACRRLVQPGVLVAVAQRPDEGAADPLGLRAAFDARLTTELELAGLSTGAIHALLHRSLGLSLPRRRLLELHAMTAGNPLYCLEIGRALVRSGGGADEHGPLPLPGSVTQLLIGRLRHAPPDAVEVLEIVSLADRPTASMLAAVRGSPERAEADLRAAITAELVEVERGRVRPVHPMLASVARSAMTAQRERHLHGVLAEAEEGAEARVRHLALATPGEDVDVAAALDAAAAALRARGAVHAVAELLGIAVDRTPRGDAVSRRRRMLELAEALLDAGELTRARDVAGALLDADAPPTSRGRAALVVATVAWYLGEPGREAVRPLHEALEAGLDDHGLAGRVHFHLAVFHDWDIAGARDHAAEAVRLLEPQLHGDPSVAGPLAAALTMQFYGEVLLGLAPPEHLLDRAIALEPSTGRVDRSTTPGIWLAATGRLDEAHAFFATHLQLDREAGILSSEADLLTRLAEVALWQGRWDEAARLSDEAIAAARQDGQDVPQPALRLRAWADACRGELDRASEAATAALGRLGATDGSLLAAAWLTVAVLVSVTRDDNERVEHLTARSAAHLGAIGIREGLRLDLSGERVAALCHLGRLDEAGALLDHVIARHERIPRAVLAAEIARGRALLAQAQGRTSEAIAATDPAVDATEWPAFDRARTLLLRGQLQRRVRDRRGAREALESALADFEALGARAWIERAQGELQRLGRYRPGSVALTPTEQQVAELAASGLPTREIAAKLFVSPKTVETHLTHIYRKLGIASRAELGARMANPQTQP